MTTLTKVLLAIIAALLIVSVALRFRIMSLKAELVECQHAAELAKTRAEGVELTLAELRGLYVIDSTAAAQRQQRIDCLTEELSKRRKWGPKPVTEEGMRKEIMNAVNTK